MDDSFDFPTLEKLPSSVDGRKKRRSSFMRGRKSICSEDLDVNKCDVNEKSKTDDSNKDETKGISLNPENIAIQQEIMLYERYKNRLKGESSGWDELLQSYKKNKEIAEINEDIPITGDIPDEYKEFFDGKPDYKLLLENLNKSKEVVTLSHASLNSTTMLMSQFMEVAERYVDKKIHNYEKQYMNFSGDAADIIMGLQK